MSRGRSPLINFIISCPESNVTVIGASCSNFLSRNSGALAVHRSLGGASASPGASNGSRYGPKESLETFERPWTAFSVNVDLFFAVVSSVLRDGGAAWIPRIVPRAFNLNPLILFTLTVVLAKPTQ